MVKLTGLTPVEAIGKKAYLLPYPLLEVRPALYELILGTCKTLSPQYSGLQCNGELYLADLQLALKGEPLYCSLRAMPIYDQAGKLFGVMQQVVSYSRPSKECSDSMQQETYFYHLADMLQDVLYRIRLFPNYHLEYLSPVLTSITGIETSSLYDNPYQVLDYIHPEDIHIMENILNGHAEQTTIIRWYRPDGTMCWHEHRIVPIVNNQGQKIALEGIIRDVTERIQVEEELQSSNQQLEASLQQLSCLQQELQNQFATLETTQHRLSVSEHRYRTLMENLDLIAIMLNHQGQITFCNDFFISLTGWGKEDLLNHHITDFLVTDSYRPKWEQHLNNTDINPRATNYFTAPIKTRDGQTLIVNFSQTLLHDIAGELEGVALIGDDITERENVRQALMSSERNFREIMDNMVDLISKTDRFGQIVYMSPSHQDVFGGDLETLMNLPLKDFIHPDDLYQVYSALKQVLREGKVTTFETRCRHFIHGYVWVEAVGNPLYENQEITGAVLSSRNITKRKRLEEELRYVGLHDALTGLYNRTYFEEEINRLNDERNHAVGLFIFDVDGLKLVNDSLGHDKGDLLLYRTSQVIKNSFRHGDVVARVGGDEFAVLLPQADQALMNDLKERLNQAVFTYNEQYPELPLSISMGMANRQSGQQLRDLYKEADNEMYRDKQQRSPRVRNDLVQTLMTALEARDYITEGHADRLQNLVSTLAARMGMPAVFVEEMKLLAQFHDIGKVGIPDRILFKPGALDPEEFAEMQRHCEIGCRIAQSSPVLAPLSELILKHHEWWDGNGYPLGLIKDDIPLPCRILAVADAFDAMTNDRPYRRALSAQAALAELEAGAGTQFDPVLVIEFCEMMRGEATKRNVTSTQKQMA